MRFVTLIATLTATLLALVNGTGRAEPAEISGNVAVEARGFLHNADQPVQTRHGLSLAAEPEFYQPLGPHSVTITPFARLDSADPERTHWDLREAYLLYVTDRWELALGARKIFWGVTESQHLVDIINQTDTVEAPDQEDKLGQPMAHLSLLNNWGTLELFALPYFRERTFPGVRGRLRGPLPVDTGHALFESGHGRHHLDLAARYSHFLGPWDVGISHFSGTSREPTLRPNGSGSRLVPFYPQIEQTGLDAQLTAGDWLIKTEAIHRTGQGNGYVAWVTGFEYTFVGLFGSFMDLGVLSEWHRDTRGSAGSPFNHDLMGGVRLAVNDPQSTEALLGVIIDPVIGSHAVFLETSRRIGDQIKLEGEIRASGGPPEDVVFHGIRNDDFVQLNVAYYF